MPTITLDLPDNVAKQLRSQQDRLPEIIALGLQELSPLPTQAYQYILMFLAKNPTSDDILNFRPLPEMQQRVQRLLRQEKNSELSSTEQAELDENKRNWMSMNALSIS